MKNDDNLILESIKKIKQDLHAVENKLNFATDPILIDSYIYELKALHMRHKFYMKLCKKNKINFI